MTSAAPKPHEFPEDRLQALAEAPITHSQLAAHLLGIPITQVTAEQRRLVKQWRYLRVYSVRAPLAANYGHSLLERVMASTDTPGECRRVEDLDFSNLELRINAHMRKMEDSIQAMCTSTTRTATGRLPSSPEWQDLPRS